MAEILEPLITSDTLKLHLDPEQEHFAPLLDETRKVASEIEKFHKASGLNTKIRHFPHILMLEDTEFNRVVESHGVTDLGMHLAFHNVNSNYVVLPYGITEQKDLERRESIMEELLHGITSEVTIEEDSNVVVRSGLRSISMQQEENQSFKRLGDRDPRKIKIGFPEVVELPDSKITSQDTHPDKLGEYTEVALLIIRTNIIVRQQSNKKIPQEVYTLYKALYTGEVPDDIDSLMHQCLSDPIIQLKIGRIK